MLKVLQLGSLNTAVTPKSMLPKIQLKAHFDAMTNFLLYKKYVLEHARCLRASLNCNFTPFSYQSDACFHQFQTFLSQNGSRTANSENIIWNHARMECHDPFDVHMLTCVILLGIFPMLMLK